MTSLSIGARLARRRVLAARSLLALTGAIALAAICAALERAGSVLAAADRALAGAACGLLLPLGVYLLVDHLCSGHRLDEALRAATRRGIHGRASGLGALMVVAAVSAGFACVLALVSVLLARGGGDPRWGTDAAQSVPLAALGSLAYVGLFAMGSEFGRCGQGRAVLLVGDWLLGSGTSTLALPWPRGHLRNLLGWEPVLGISQPFASVLLVVFSLVFVGVALWRVRP
ncbi:MAG: hypothetical protein JW940_10020 [Polyangiaceae bacterium]|nr:hypothetical protein [Polyangiaceae bacterium]